MIDLSLLVQTLLCSLTLGMMVFMGLLVRIALVDGPRLHAARSAEDQPPQCAICGRTAVSQRASCVDGVWRDIWLCRDCRDESFVLDLDWDRIWNGDGGERSLD